jgi:hypothetical protein
MPFGACRLKDHARWRPGVPRTWALPSPARRVDESAHIRPGPPVHLQLWSSKPSLTTDGHLKDALFGHRNGVRFRHEFYLQCAVKPYSTTPIIRSFYSLIPEPKEQEWSDKVSYDLRKVWSTCATRFWARVSNFFLLYIVSQEGVVPFMSHSILFIKT